MKPMTAEEIVNEIFHPKPTTHRDPDWIDHIKDGPCWATGFESSEYAEEAVDPAHVGRSGGGMGKKTHDFHVFALRHSLHQDQHGGSEKMFWLEMMKHYPWFVMSAVKAFCTIEYLKHKTGAKDDVALVQAVLREREVA